MRKKIVFDFDGVIHKYTSGWKGYAAIPDGVMPGAIEAILDYLSEGFEVHIYSSRSKSLRGRRAMKAFMMDALTEHWLTNYTHGIYADYWITNKSDLCSILGNIKWPWFKPPAWLTIDDRAIQFQGVFPGIDEINNFKPWKPDR